jgi:hypothetical protein
MRLAPWSVVTLLLVACPGTDDDDSAADDDDTPSGSAPVVDSVIVCELPAGRAQCADENATGATKIRFDAHVSDEDEDLNNPNFYILLNDEPPWLEGRIEDDLEGGATVQILLGCAFYDYGSTLDWKLSFRDEAGNESTPAEGTWDVPLDSPGVGDAGACGM